MKRDVVTADFLAELADRLEERHDSMSPTVPPILRDHHVVIGREPANGALDLVGDVRNHLDRRAEVLAAPLFGDDGQVNPPVVTLFTCESERSMNRS